MASLDGTVKFLQASTGQPLGKEVALAEGVTKIQFSPKDSDTLLVGCEDGTLAKISANASQIVYKATDTQGLIVDLQISPVGDRYLVGSTDKTAVLRSPGDGKALSAPMLHGDIVSRCGFSRNGNYAWTCSPDRLLRVFKASGPSEAREFVFSTWPTCVDYTSQDKFLSTTYEGEVALWDQTQALWKASRRTNRLLYCEVDANDRLALVCGESTVAAGGDPGAGVTLLLDLQTGLPVSPPLHHFGRVNKAVFDATNQRVITASADHSARVWTIAKDERSIEELTQLASILSGAEVTESSQIMPLSAVRIAELFDKAYKTRPRSLVANQPKSIAGMAMSLGSSRKARASGRAIAWQHDQQADTNRTCIAKRCSSSM